MKKISAIILASSLGLAAQAQLINAFNGESLSSYTTTPILDNSLGAGEGVSFSDSTGALVASYVGTGTSAEQSLFLTSTALPAGDALIALVNVPVSSTAEDLGIAIAASATPTPASSGNSYNSRTLYDYASVSVRPSQAAVRVNTSISGTLTSANGVLGAAANTVEALFIDNNGGGSFTFGYIDTGSVIHTSETVAFSPSSLVGSAIGIYGDLRATGASLGGLSDLSIQPIPEPSILALGGMGLAGMLVRMRRNK